jgi:hypothetical protein
MKSLVIMDSEAELEIIKERVKNGEKVYTVIQGKTYNIEFNSADNVFNKREIGKRELDDLFRNFPASEIQEGSDSENKEQESKTVSEDGADIYTRIKMLEQRTARIENALYTPILQKSV